MLIPMGFLNEFHEPPVFHGVSRRPRVERVINPTTWRENGGGAFGGIGPFSYRTYVVADLSSSGFSSGSGLRGGRQKGSKSRAEDFAWTGRVDLTDVPGRLGGGKFFVGESGQGVTLTDGQTIGVRVDFDLHGQYHYRGLEVRGLYAWGDVGDAGLINQSLSLTGNDSLGSSLEGGYIELAFDLVTLKPGGGVVGHSVRALRDVRYSGRRAAGLREKPSNDRSVTTFGFDLKPIPNVVLKLDYQDFRNEAGTATNQWNLGIGYLL